MLVLQLPVEVSKCTAHEGLVEVVPVFTLRVPLAAMFPAPPVELLPNAYAVLLLLLVKVIAPFRRAVLMLSAPLLVPAFVVRVKVPVPIVPEVPREDKGR